MIKFRINKYFNRVVHKTMRINETTKHQQDQSIIDAIRSLLQKAEEQTQENYYDPIPVEQHSKEQEEG